jgi:hypothetical protein
MGRRIVGGKDLEKWVKRIGSKDHWIKGSLDCKRPELRDRGREIEVGGSLGRIVGAKEPEKWVEGIVSKDR